MSSQSLDQNQNVYHNSITGVTRNPVIDNPDEIDAAFVESANQVLASAADLIRALVGTHQSAAAIVVQNDWSTIRKFFSLSSKYAAWADYKTPATGYGIHNWILQHNKPVRLTQAELEAHPEWKQFGGEQANHPPMNGWLAAPIVDRNGTNWGLLQASDKYDGDFTDADERHFVQLAQLVSSTLESLWETRNLRKQLNQA